MYLQCLSFLLSPRIWPPFYIPYKEDAETNYLLLTAMNRIQVSFADLSTKEWLLRLAATKVSERRKERERKDWNNDSGFDSQL